MTENLIGKPIYNQSESIFLFWTYFGVLDVMLAISLWGLVAYTSSTKTCGSPPSKPDKQTTETLLDVKLTRVQLVGDSGRAKNNNGIN